MAGSLSLIYALTLPPYKNLTKVSKIELSVLTPYPLTHSFMAYITLNFFLEIY